MKDLYRYIFTKAYFFCITIFKEKEFPQYFATGMLTFAITANFYILLSLIEYLMLPIRFNYYGEYYKYFALVIFAIALLYVNNKKRYLVIIKSCKELPNKRKKKLKVYSIIYLLFLFVSFFLLGALIREYNIVHPKIV
ncbi:hypothetical protein BZG01_10185 [Labilibaculum manganireducens]|uniref:Uncharacterized protein n=1 Tax=Labilibaculum manganireducens TaxID=1940525 RepID=A0A2N3I8L6_9BACT|nr:hypothetical protein BZG01_10185 [Labilibaculum manganireducens]